MRVLKIHVEAPSAHFSVPYTIFERKTYPIPMFSTIIGFLCNILGNGEKIDRFICSEFSIAVVGDHKGILEEYTWYRNLSLSKDAHKEKYFALENRVLEGEVEHPGGQIPVRIQTLLEPAIDVFVKASDETLTLLYESFQKMDTISHLHIGRAEDVLSDLRVEFVEVKIGKAFSVNGYTWLPTPICADVPSLEKYEKLYQNVIAPVHRVSTLYKVISGKRIFSFVQAKLHKGALPLVDYETIDAFLCEETPLFFTKIKGWGDRFAGAGEE